MNVGQTTWTRKCPILGLRVSHAVVFGRLGRIWGTGIISQLNPSNPTSHVYWLVHSTISNQHLVVLKLLLWKLLLWRRARILWGYMIPLSNLHTAKSAEVGVSCSGSAMQWILSIRPWT